MEEIFRRTRERWDFTFGFPLVKGNWQACGQCESDHWIYRHWIPHNRANSGHVTRYPHRCDVSFKCVECGAVWLHGVVVPPEAIEKLNQAKSGNAKPSIMYRREALSRYIKWHSQKQAG